MSNLAWEPQATGTKNYLKKILGEISLIMSGAPAGRSPEVDVQLKKLKEVQEGDNRL